MNKEYPNLVELRNVRWDDKKQLIKIEVWVQGRYVQAANIRIDDKKEYFYRKLKGAPQI